MTNDNGEMDYMQGRWPICDDSPLPPNMLDEYIAKHGEEHTLGYIEAVRDFQKHFQRCFQGFIVKEYGITHHIKKVGAESMVKKLFHRNSELLKFYSLKKNNPDTPQIL